MVVQERHSTPVIPFSGLLQLTLASGIEIPWPVLSARSPPSSPMSPRKPEACATSKK
ncbi:hypothetical protein LINPERPRIM_LOCUS15689 [Linum perenne]